MGVLPNSFTRGMGRMTGCLGEVVVNNFIKKSKYVGDSVFTHDLVYKNKKIEIKSKTCSTIVWIVGWLPTTKFFKLAKYREKGDQDEHGFIYKAAGFHTEMSNLNNPFSYK